MKIIPSALLQRLKRRILARSEMGREELAARYLQGNGIEIGARNWPLALPAGAKASYVDRIGPEEMKKDYAAALEGEPVPVDVMDDARNLEKFTDDSLDFVIANHLLEHLEDPLGALKNFLRVLRTGGILFLSVPDKNHTFDKSRAVTTIEHLLRDHLEGPARSRLSHHEESVRHTPGELEEEEIQKRAKAYMDAGRDIHFHCWRQTEMFEIFVYLQKRENLNFEIETFEKHHKECIFVVRKVA